jgi:hypothetical protein
MARTASLVCLISTFSGCCKKAENALEDVAHVGAHNKTKAIYILYISMVACTNYTVTPTGQHSYHTEITLQAVTYFIRMISVNLVTHKGAPGNPY